MVNGLQTTNNILCQQNVFTFSKKVHSNIYFTKRMLLVTGEWLGSLRMFYRTRQKNEFLRNNL